MSLTVKMVCEKITLKSTIQWETRQASFPMGTVSPQVGISLSPLNTLDSIYLTQVFLPRVTLACYVALQRIQELLGALFKINKKRYGIKCHINELGFSR